MNNIQETLRVLEQAELHNHVVEVVNPRTRQIETDAKDLKDEMLAMYNRGFEYSAALIFECYKQVTDKPYLYITYDSGTIESYKKNTESNRDV